MHPKRAIRWLRRHRAVMPRRVFVMLLTLAMLVPAMAGGAPYVWCEGMQQARLSCCCHGRRAHTVEHEKQSSRRDVIESTCCVGRRVSSLPTSDVHVDVRTSFAPPNVIAWLTLAMLLPIDDAPSVHLRRRDDREARAGPHVPLYVADCAYLN